MRITPYWQYRGEVFSVPVTVAGEFLEGAAFIFEQRLVQSLAFLRMFELRTFTIATSLHCGRVVMDRRREKRLRGASKSDLWNAAFTLQLQARFITENLKHFRGVPGLQLIPYG